MQTTLPDYLFVDSCEGSLFDTRRADWPRHPLRTVYRRTFADIENTQQLRATLRAGPYAWPGGYPMFFVTSDGAALSFDSVRAEYAQCARSIRDKLRDGWRIVACAINYEDTELTCEHSGKPIESAYGGDE
jgi:hypothetical protein